MAYGDNGETTRQSDSLRPPRRGAIASVAVDATARPYDLSRLNFGGIAFRPDEKNDDIFVSFEADGNDIYFHLSPTTASDLDDTYALTAGDPIAFNDKAPIRIPKDGTRDEWLNRLTDRFLILKCAAGKTATLRFYASSPPPGVS